IEGQKQKRKHGQGLRIPRQSDQIQFGPHHHKKDGDQKAVPKGIELPHKGFVRGHEGNDHAGEKGTQDVFRPDPFRHRHKKQDQRKNAPRADGNGLSSDLFRNSGRPEEADQAVDDEKTTKSSNSHRVLKTPSSVRRRETRTASNSIVQKSAMTAVSNTDCPSGSLRSPLSFSTGKVMLTEMVEMINVMKKMSFTYPRP